MLVSAVQPVAILSAVFWVNCSFWRLVCESRGDQMVLACSMIGLVMVL